MPQDGFRLVLVGSVRDNLVREETVINPSEPCFPEYKPKQARLRRRSKVYHRTTVRTARSQGASVSKIVANSCGRAVIPRNPGHL